MRLLDPLQLTSTQKQFMLLLGTYRYSLYIVVVSDSQYSIQELMVMKVDKNERILSNKFVSLCKGYNFVVRDFRRRNYCISPILGVFLDKVHEFPQDAER